MSELSKAKVSFKILLQNEWLPVDSFLEEPDQLLSYYLEVKELTSKSLRGGFFIEADGLPWNEAQYIDEFKMTRSWFDAIEKLLEGAEYAEVWAWKESALTLERHGNIIELENVQLGGGLICPKLSFDFYDFVKQILMEGKKFAYLARILRESLQPLENCDSSQFPYNVKERLRILKEGLPDDLTEKIEVMEFILEESIPEKKNLGQIPEPFS